MELSSTHRKLIEKKKCLNHHYLHVVLTVSTKFDKWVWFTKTLKEKEIFNNNNNSNNKRRVQIKH